MKASLALGLGWALAACSGGTLAPLPSEGGATDASEIVDAGAPDRSAPFDASGDVRDATNEPLEPCTLGAPAFNPAGPPPAGLVVSVGQVVTIAPPPGLPAGGQLFYTLNGAVPTPTSSPLYIAPLALTFPAGSTETIMAIAHAPGCVDSVPAVAVFAEDLPGSVLFTPPCFQPVSGPFDMSLQSTPGSTICYTLDGTTPTCNAATAVCTGATQTYSKPFPVDPTKSGNAQVTISTLTCQAGHTPWTQPLTCTFQLAAPYLASTNAAGAGLPGWDWSGTGAPKTTMSVPGDAGAPYGPFQVLQVGDPPCASATSCTGPANQLADFVCWSNTGPATCACETPLPLTTAISYATLPASADVKPGDTLSVIACQTSPPTNTPGVYATSVVTTVQF